MTIERKSTGNVTVLSVMGDIMLSAADNASLSDTVRDALGKGRTRLVLDLAHVKYVDSWGLGELVQSLTAAKNRGGSVKLLNVTKRLNDLLVMTKLLTVFDCFDDEATAVASFGTPTAA